MADRNYEYDPVETEAEVLSVNQQHYRMEVGQVWRQYIIAGIGTSSLFKLILFFIIICAF